MSKWTATSQEKYTVYNAINGNMLPSPLGDVQTHIWRMRAYIFCQYIRQAADLLYGNIDPDKMTPLQKYIAEAPNERSPFRECTTNCIRTKGPQGPYYGERIQTNGGLFSVVLWRVVSLHTPFEKEHKMVFKDLEDWEDKTSSLDKAYICNTRAHITPTNRSSTFAPVYWENIHKLGWEEYSAAENHPTFSKTYDMLYNLPGGRGRCPLPQLGSIGTLHLVANVTYTGVFPQVNYEEIGEYMFNIDSGSSRSSTTLLALEEDEERQIGNTGKGKGKAKGKGKTKSTKLPAIKCAEGAQKASILIDHTLTEEEIACFGPNDTILAEHALCKFQGAFKRGLLDNVVIEYLNFNFLMYHKINA
jgi:hypothetical protein